ncbi:hypothetical protein Acsp03_24840 [Actinomadura sp. NBRC 104412]|uniref:DUF4041 domain-containing protein n=1 Tax=Actinomadura sp. NBRC 104412 TaxID=3032203 RepID=UPI0024A22609|nr:DUF4041 domain-containing protein [Actinomadura sp. NBRC 104412]GLZ05018.1 hypothetical protein Acsp03_24840 [Actinomadura sp. NBRC 104412]
MTVQPHTTPYIGADVDPGETAHLLKVLGFFVKGEERLLALVTTTKALPKLTHVAVTDTRVIGFSAPDLSREGPRQELPLSAITDVETRKSYQQRWFLVVKHDSGEESDFGDVHDTDAPQILQLIRTQIATPTPPVPVPSAAAPPPRPSNTSAWLYNSPPGWPAPPIGWTPPPGWQPAPSWPPAPPGWQFWTPAAPPPPAPASPPEPPEPPVAWPQYVGAKLKPDKVRDLLIRLARHLHQDETLLALTRTAKMRPALNHLVITDRRIAAFSIHDLNASGFRLTAELGTISAVELRSGFTHTPRLVAHLHNAADVDFGDLNDTDAATVLQLAERLVTRGRPVQFAAAPATSPPARPERRPAFGGKKQRIEELEAENARLLRELQRVGALEPLRLAEENERHRRQAAALADEIRTKREELDRIRQSIVETQDVALLQEAGVYEYQHPLADAVAYKAELAKIKDRIKTMARGDRAVVGATDWSVNGSLAQGRKMVRDFSKLMLRAYNAEADNLIRTMRPYKLRSSIERLDKTAQTIERLGKTMNIRVSPDYRRLRIQELRLTADHLAKTEEEKERIRAERERQREEEKARKEFEREKARLLKAQSQVQTALARLEANGDTAGAAELRAKLADVANAISDVEGRAANTRTGHVYVISNIGAFGERMVKIGMTRRLDPTERVRELGDASVPFHFDVHALIFSEDAVGLENRLHQEFADRRVNRVNQRREFFYATPSEVRAVLERIAGNHLLEYTETPEAQEWRSSNPAP